MLKFCISTREDIETSRPLEEEFRLASDYFLYLSSFFPFSFIIFLLICLIFLFLTAFLLPLGHGEMRLIKWELGGWFGHPRTWHPDLSEKLYMSLHNKHLLILYRSNHRILFAKSFLFSNFFIILLETELALIKPSLPSKPVTRLAALEVSLTCLSQAWAWFGYLGIVKGG